MAYNTPDDWDQAQDVIQNNLLDLQQDLAREGVKASLDQFVYSFFDRIEYLALPSSLVYPDGDLPINFGVQRGYGGGGVHTGLIRTEYHRLPARSHARAERLLDLFNKYFWQILEQSSDPEAEPWDKLTI